MGALLLLFLPLWLIKMVGCRDMIIISLDGLSYWLALELWRVWLPPACFLPMDTSRKGKEEN